MKSLLIIITGLCLSANAFAEQEWERLPEEQGKLVIRAIIDALDSEEKSVTYKCLSEKKEKGAVKETSYIKLGTRYLKTHSEVFENTNSTQPLFKLLRVTWDGIEKTTSEALISTNSQYTGITHIIINFRIVEEKITQVNMGTIKDPNYQKTLKTTELFRQRVTCD